MRNAFHTLAAILALTMAAPLTSAVEQGRPYRVGIVSLGGSYERAIDGLRDGLKKLGLREGQEIIFDVRDTKGDLNLAEDSARSLEAANVDVIYAIATSVAQAAKRGTHRVPVVFYAGSDPVAFGLVESFARPGGRLTGVHGLFTDLTAKRLELLKELVPNVRRVATFYNPANPAAQQSMKIARDAARTLSLQLVERRAASVEELRAGVRSLKVGEADAICYVADAMVNSQSHFVIDAANSKRIPTIFSTPENAGDGALAAYGASYYSFGLLSAKHVQRVLLGTSPGDLPVEQIDRIHLALNLKTAKALALTIPQSLLLRADEIIQ